MSSTTAFRGGVEAARLGVEARRRHSAARLPRARRYAERLVAVHGSIAEAGREYDERHGFRLGSGERLLARILDGRVAGVTAETLDRLWVLI